MERRENKEYEDYEGNDIMKRRNKNDRKKNDNDRKRIDRREKMERMTKRKNDGNKNKR